MRLLSITLPFPTSPGQSCSNLNEPEMRFLVSGTPVLKGTSCRLEDVGLGNFSSISSWVLCFCFCLFAKEGESYILKNS